MFAERLGDRGPAMILMHGWGRSRHQMLPLADVLSRHYQTHVLDLPGFGESPRKDNVVRTEDYADEVLDYLRKQGVSRAIFLGHSFGGRVAVQCAARSPESVERLILIGAAGLQKKEKNVLRRLKRRAIRLLGQGCRFVEQHVRLPLYRDFFIPRFASHDYRHAGPMLPVLLAAVRENLESLLPQVKCPTLLIWGREDTETPLEFGERMHRLIPKSNLVALPERGHDLFHDASHHLLVSLILSHEKDNFSC